MLASDATLLEWVVVEEEVVPLGVSCGGEDDECGDEEDMSEGAGCTSAASQARGDSDWLAAVTEMRDSTQRRAIGGYVGIHRRPWRIRRHADGSGYVRKSK